MFDFLKNVFWIFFYGTIFLILLFFIIRAYLRSYLANALLQLKKGNPKQKRLAFLHPYCYACGGGEKVLFTMISALINNPRSQYPLEIVIYTGDPNLEHEFLQKVEKNFGFKIPLNCIKFIRISGRNELLDPKPYFTMIRQIIGSMIFAYKAIKAYPPDLFFDTTGLSFSYWVVKMLMPNCKVLCYINYPFISCEMFDDVVVNKEKKVKRSSRLLDSKFLSLGKMWYYRSLIYFYGKMGNYADFVYTGNSWSNTHMRNIWRKWQNSTFLLFPPCYIEQFLNIPLKNKKNLIISCAQFRPEKDHAMQIEIFKEVKTRLPNLDIEFYIIGSCRNESDEKLLENLQQKAKSLGVSSSISFKKNLPYPELLEIFANAKIGIHTMKVEHFGIAIVEMISAGIIVAAHNSAGPKYDIICEKIDNYGFLCMDKEDYVNSIVFTLGLKEEKIKEMVDHGRKEMKKFNPETFIELFLGSFYEKKLWE